MFTILTTLFSILVVMTNIVSTNFFSCWGLSFPAGILLYPLSLLITDLVTEFYGAQKARQMIWIAFAMTLMSLGVLELSYLLPGSSPLFKEALGKTPWVVSASLTAYLVGQMLDIKLYTAIKRWTQGRFLWLRNTGSMLISQLVDTLIVNWIYLYLGLGFTLETVSQVILFSYLFKAAFTLLNAPVYYLLVNKLKEYHELSTE